MPTLYNPDNDNTDTMIRITESPNIGEITQTRRNYNYTISYDTDHANSWQSISRAAIDPFSLAYSGRRSVRDIFMAIDPAEPKKKKVNPTYRECLKLLEENENV